MEIEIKESVSLEDGTHKGTITAVEYREEPYKYVDVVIKEDVTGFDIKYGCPNNDSEKGKLVLLLKEFKDLKVGDKIEIDDILVGRKVNFMTLKEKKDGNEYSRVVSNSVKPQ